MSMFPSPRLRSFARVSFVCCLLSSTPTGVLSQKSGTGSSGIVATAHPLASEAGLEMLQQGGNAVDAAVAAAFAIGVVEPDGSGLGGGGALVLYDRAADTAVYVDFYQQAGSRVNMVRYDAGSDRGTARAVLVPGDVAGLTETLERFGTLSLPVVMAPAIRYARSGFVIDTILSGIIASNEDLLRRHPASFALMQREGDLLKAGDTLRQPELASVLQRISLEGRDGFYTGPVAESIVAAIRKGDGDITLSDLAMYRARFSEPVRGRYGGYDVLSAGAPQSGISVIQALNMLAFAELPKRIPFSSSPSSIHIVAEVLRRVYADRFVYVVDPAFHDVPVDGLLSMEYAKERSGMVNRDRVSPPRYRDTEVGDPAPFDLPSRSFMPQRDYPILQHAEGAHTTHISVVDADGMAVALTQTLGTFFGSGVSVQGVFLNDGRANFSRDGNVNAPEPGKRPRSTIAPTLLLRNGVPFAVAGTPGGMRIIATLVQIIVGIVDGGQGAVEANDEPRFFCQKFDDELHLEGMFADSIRTRLLSMGHNLTVHATWDHYFGGAQLIVADSLGATYSGSADRRRSGSVRVR